MTARLREVAFATTVLLCLTATARSTEVGYARRYGVGAILGDPTGVSGKIWVGPVNAVDLGVGAYGYGYRGHCPRDREGRPFCDPRWGRASLSLHADYLWQSKLVDRTVQLDWHLGAGAKAFFLGGPCAFECWNAGVRGPIGLDLTFDRPSFLEVFLEIAPVFYVVPSTFLAFDGALGVRGYF